MMFANAPLGAAMMGVGALTNLISGPLNLASQRKTGLERYNKASEAYKSRLEKKPDYYTNSGITKGFVKAKNSLMHSNSQQTSALLDRYSNIQRKQMSNRIKSGLTSGAAQASQVQNNIAFQRTANELFNKQGQSLSNLALRESQAKMNMAPMLEARKNQAARNSLVSNNISNPSALGSLTSKLSGGY